jgi:protein TonB
MDGSVAAASAQEPRRFASRRRLGVLAWRAGEPFVAPSAPVHTRARGRTALAVALALAAHAGLFVGAARQPAAPLPAAPHRFFPLQVIWEEEPAPAVVTAVPAAPRVRPRPRAPQHVQPAPPPAPATVAATALTAAPAPAAALAPPPVAAPPPRLHAVFQPAPRYPRAARRRGAEGTTWLRVELAPTGRVLRVAVERSAGHRDLDRAAADAVRTWRFAPPPEGMDASDLWFRIPVDFRLR